MAALGVAGGHGQRGGRGPDLIGDGARGIGPRAGQQHHELLAAEAADHVCAPQAAA